MGLGKNVIFVKYTVEHLCDWDLELEVRGLEAVRAVAAHTEMSQCRFAKLQWQDTTRCSWSNRTAGGTSNISWALSWDSRSRGAPVCASPPADGWEVLCRCVYVLCWCVLARMSSTVCEWVAVRGSQRSQLAGARLRRHRDPDCFALVAAQSRLLYQNQPRASLTFTHNRAEFHVPFICFTEHWEEAHIKRPRSYGAQSVQYEIKKKNYEVNNHRSKQ